MALIELLSGVTWISILLFIVGLGFVIAEMWTPGFGTFGILGIISLVGCIFVTANTVMEGIILTAILTVILLILFLVFMILVSKGKLPNKLILHDSESKEDGYTGTGNYEFYKGQTGTIIAPCRPVGNADFDGKKIEVISKGEFINKGDLVEVIEIEGNRVVVKSIQNAV